MKKVFYLLLLVLITVIANAQTPVPVTFSNFSPIGTPTRVMVNLPSDSDYAILADQNANLLVKIYIPSGLKLNVLGLNGATDFSLDYVKKSSPSANATLLGSFQSGGNSYLFADLNPAGTVATINTTFMNTGSNSRIYKAIQLTNGNLLVNLNKDPAFYNNPSVYSINNIVCGEMAELNPVNGAVIPRNLVPSIANPPIVLPIPMITDMGYLPSGDIFFSGSFTEINGVTTQKAAKLSANGVTLTPLTTLPGSNSSAANVYTNGLVTYNGVTYVVYTNATATSPTLVTFNEVTNMFGSISGSPFYINPQSSPYIKFGRIFVTGTKPTSPGSTIGAYDPVTGVWYTYDGGLFTNGYSPNQTVTSIVWAKTSNCAVIYGNMNQNGTTLASGVSYQAKLCLSTVLPVTLTYFTLQLHGENALLSWKVETPMDGEIYKVERSSDRINFSEVNNQTGDAQRTQFTFIDHLIPGTYSYRLKMIDRDGSYKYSPIRLVKFDGNNNSAVVVYPNPLQRGNSLQISISNANMQSWALVDLSGKIVGQSAKLSVTGTVSLQLPNVLIGYYVLKIKTDKGSFDEKIVVQ